MSSRIDSFLAMLARGQDSALLRFSLGSEYLAVDDPKGAVGHLLVAVTLDKNYSAAWKLLGKAQSASGDPDAAIKSYKDGIRIAQDNGDRQAAKEMTVFLRRLEKRKPT